MGELHALGTALSHTALRKLRQADSLTGAQIARQVRQENYAAWQRWEQRQDFPTIMAGRYSLAISEQTDLHQWYTAGAQQTLWAPAMTRQTSDDLPLWQAARNYQSSERITTMELLKISVSKDARIDKDTLYMSGHDAGQPWTAAEFDGWLRNERPPADNVRIGLAYRLRDWQRFEHDGETCRAIATPTTGVKGLDIWIHVQRRKADSVEYSAEPVLQITGNGTSHPVTLRVSQSGYRYNDLVHTIGSPESLQALGAQHFFESDLRGLCKGLLASVCVPLWPGILLLLTREAQERVNTLQTLLGALDAGTVTLSCLSLDNTPANREALARELTEGFTEQLEKLQERLGFTAPNYAGIQAEYDAISAKLALAESVLGVEIDCLDAQVAVELGLIREAPVAV